MYASDPFLASGARGLVTLVVVQNDYGIRLSKLNFMPIRRKFFVLEPSVVTTILSLGVNFANFNLAWH
jgi:hypothetical protein